MRTHASARAFVALLLGSGIALAASGPSQALEIVGPQQVLERFVYTRDGTSILAIDGREWALITDPASPLVSQLGDGQFHPMDPRLVRDAVRDLGAGLLPAGGTILVLPYPRAYPVESSCEGSTVFLSPGIREVSAEHVHTTVVHELGHLVQHGLVPERSELWQQYLDLRELRDESLYYSTAIHRNRPREIFAEDFRHLFGGALATYSGSIENPYLPLPATVPGLEAWFLDAVHRPLAVRIEEPDPVSYPNPYDASAGGSLRIRFQAPGGARGPLQADVFSVTGRRLTVLQGAIVSDEAVVFSWDGRNRSGDRVASGTYFVRWVGRPEVGTARVHVLH